MLLFRWPSTHNFCYKTSWRWVWECESYSYLILSETVNVDQVNCGKVNYWYLDLKSIPPPYDNRQSSLARWQWASWRTAVPSQRWDWNTWQLLTWEVLVYVHRTCCICMCILFVRFFVGSIQTIRLFPAALPRKQSVRVLLSPSPLQPDAQCVWWKYMFQFLTCNP